MTEQHLREAWTGWGLAKNMAGWIRGWQGRRPGQGTKAARQTQGRTLLGEVSEGACLVPLSGGQGRGTCIHSPQGEAQCVADAKSRPEQISPTSGSPGLCPHEELRLGRSHCPHSADCAVLRVQSHRMTMSQTEPQPLRGLQQEKGGQELILQVGWYRVLFARRLKGDECQPFGSVRESVHHATSAQAL